MKGRVAHIEGAKFLCETENHSMVLDDGKTSLTPVQTMLLSMAACTAMDVWTIMMKKREKIRNLGVDIEAEREEKHPRIFRKVKIVYTFHGEVGEKACRDAIELSMEKYCSISNMIKRVAEIETDFRII